MSPCSRHPRVEETHHGVFLNIDGKGVFIIGNAGIGKSSLALDILHNGHSLIADDCVNFRSTNTSVKGHCPPMLAGLLHTRELGLLSLSDLFGPSAWQAESQLNYIIRLQKNSTPSCTLSIETESYTICEQLFPVLTLDINTPATILNRIKTWLSMQSSQNNAIETLKQRQQIQMEALQ